jgi:hypothetical protein
MRANFPWRGAGRRLILSLSKDEGRSTLPQGGTAR